MYWVEKEREGKKKPRRTDGWELAKGGCPARRLAFGTGGIG